MLSIEDEAAVRVETMPGHLARRFQQAAVAIFQAEIAATGMDLTPVQYAALDAVGGRPAIDQVSLAGQIACDRTTIVGVVDRLVAKGLVTRRVSPHDRRVRELAITSMGIVALKALEIPVARAQTVMLERLTSGEATTLIRLLVKATTPASGARAIPPAEAS